MDEKIREWYMREYPTDTLGQDLSTKASFTDLFIAIATNRLYQTMGVGDSLVRERLFEKLSALLGKDYDFVYDAWLAGSLQEVM
jgi:hypothetical protein